MMLKPVIRCLCLVAFLASAPFATLAEDVAMQETGFWETEVKSGALDPIEKRMPRNPFVVDLAV